MSISTSSPVSSISTTTSDMNPSRDQLRQLFEECDQDGSGYLCREEVRHLCGNLGIGTQEADALFEDLDLDKDGKIDFNDFEQGFIRFQNGDYSATFKGQLMTIEETPEEVSPLHSPKLPKTYSTQELKPNPPVGLRGKSRSSSALQTHYYQNGYDDDEASDEQQASQALFQELMENMRKLEEENRRLAEIFMREKKEHELHLNRLEEEMDSQVKEVERRVKMTAREEVETQRRSLRELMAQEMNELQAHLSMFDKVDQWLKDNTTNQNDEKWNEVREKLNDALQENRQLRLSLLDTQTTVALMRKELAQIKSQYEEKCRQLYDEKERLEEIMGEQQGLSHHLALLQGANRSLQDTNDVLKTVFDGGSPFRSHNPSPTPSLNSFVLNNNNNGNGNARDAKVKAFASSKRGSVISDYMNSEGEESKTCCGSTNINNNHHHQHSHNPSDVDQDFSLDYDSVLSEREEESCPAMRSRADSAVSYASSSTTDHHHQPCRNSWHSSSHQSASPEAALCRPSQGANQKNGCLPQMSAGRQRPDLTLTSPQGTHSSPDQGANQVSQTSSTAPQRTYKVVFVGDAAVGKSSFILRFTKNVFVTQMSSTLGVDFQVKSLEVDGRHVALQVWDTAGQERFRSITKSYFRKADGIILMYDVSNEVSFLNVRDWISSINESSVNEIPILLIGNKTDLRVQLSKAGRRTISTEEGQKLAKHYGIQFAEASAKDGSNIIESVMQLTREMMDKEDAEIEQSSIVQLVEREDTSSSFKCCQK